MRSIDTNKGNIMAQQVELSTTSYKTPLHHRIIASMPVKASWIDSVTGETVNVEGLTENLGETSALVNLDTLPPVGCEVRLKLMDENKSIIDVTTRVIRVQRDPGKPMAALTILENLKKWKNTAMTAADAWVTRHWLLNYEEEWVN